MAGAGALGTRSRYQMLASLEETTKMLLNQHQHPSCICQQSLAATNSRRLNTQRREIKSLTHTYTKQQLTLSPVCVIEVKPCPWHAPYSNLNLNHEKPFPQTHAAAAVTPAISYANLQKCFPAIKPLSDERVARDN